MYKFLFFFLSINFFLSSQKTYTQIKTNPDKIIIDGNIDPKEQSNAVEIDFDIEFNQTQLFFKFQYLIDL